MNRTLKCAMVQSVKCPHTAVITVFLNVGIVNAGAHMLGVLGCRWLAEALTSLVQHDEEGLQGCCRQYTWCTCQVSRTGARDKIFGEPIAELKTIRVGCGGI